MAGALDTIDKTETLLILVLVGIGGYLLYQSWDDFTNWINQLTGAGADNTYANAAAQTATHPITTAGTIAGGWWDDIFGSTQTLPSQLSSVGYTKIGASGQHWSCTGPQGAPNDTCSPVTIDANGNTTVAGPGILAVNAN